MIQNEHKCHDTMSYNVINDDGTEWNVSDKDYWNQVIQRLRQTLPEFDSYLFIFFNNNSTKLPISRNFVHPKKILIWHGTENKQNRFDELKKRYLHIFSTYVPSSDGITSIPLGTHTVPIDSSVIPIKERLLNRSFVGCLNRNRFGFASALAGVPEKIFATIMWGNRAMAVRYINTVLKYRYNRDMFHFGLDFNKTLDTNSYHYYLRNSKIAFVPRGWINAETFRLYEAMRYGCVVISERLPEREYYDNLPIIQVDNMKEAIQISETLLRSPEELERYSNLTQKYYVSTLSPVATANLVLRTLIGT